MFTFRFDLFISFLFFLHFPSIIVFLILFEIILHLNEVWSVGAHWIKNSLSQIFRKFTNLLHERHIIQGNCLNIHSCFHIGEFSNFP